MLIDINANIGHWPFRQTKGNTCKALLERMDQYGIDVSVVSNMNGIFYKNTQASNEELYDEIGSEPLFRDRFIPFAIINPIYGGWKRDMDICTIEMKMKGIRLYPKYHDYELTDPACIELVKMARDRGLVVALTLRMVDSRSRSWMDIDSEWNLADVIPIIKEVPDARYMVLNIANGINANDEDIELFKNAELIFDTSGRNIYNLSELINKFGKEIFAFGSHSPILDYLTGLLRIESLRKSEADEATKELLKSGNARRMLGI
jgi:predicted TIM-barrel fold metal-dependent hydrolase